MNVRLIRLLGFFGMIAPLIAAVMIFLSVQFTPGWSASSQTLSELGSGEFGAVLFNSGLPMAGSLMMVFGAGLWEFSKETMVGKVGSGLYLLSSVIVVVLGVVTIDVQPLHDFIATTLFMSLPLGVAVSSINLWRKEMKPYAALGFAAAVIGFGVWGLAAKVTAVYQIVALVPAGLWQMALGYWMFRRLPPEKFD
ncbi:DUF998 domain-containing protein [Candidatus Bathyarchaeota archaeon]|nr:DUF998 domain-containing protein [Candidatus Bathyarchaeota archaeon]